MMIKKLVTIVLLFTLQSSNAQFYKTVLPSAEFNNALQKIVLDFRYNFENITGEKLYSQGEVEHYESTIKLPGSTECIIYRYHSVIDTTASWQGILYQGEDYREAVKAYRNTIKLLNKSRMQWIDRSVAGFSGVLQEPGEGVKFTVSSLYLDTSDPRYKHFTAEVELVPNYAGWQVNVNMHNKKPDNSY